ncbi:Delta 8-sphingoloid desaturase protein [Mycena sanguinolenta]|uniref:Delta 8-(E)-sphingolipid desaturase n=1 Tax=Mycena sanguinolenta TaxID=230812 RepID=A0A8H6YMQ8_9AGAR|nr:Delta 8-sphingoloid desaturase protein [Mycena sanguinolenta]
MSSTIWTRENVASEILAGAHLVVFQDHLLRIPLKWFDQHPGGTLCIQHFVGRDATDEIESYHPDHVLELVRRYQVGKVVLPWRPLVPPVMSGWVRTNSNVWYNEAGAIRNSSSPQILLVQKSPDATDTPSREVLEPGSSILSAEDQAQHSAAYKVLHKRIRDSGLYNTRYLAGYGPDALRYALLASLSFYAYHRAWFLTSAAFLGLLWQQLAFLAHDLGHVSVTHNWTIDRILGIVVADCIGGVSISWWVDDHNVHHLVPNHPSHDPTIEHLPFLAISPAFFDSLWSSHYKRTLHFDKFAKFFVQVQHRLFYIVLALARFNLYASSYPFLARKVFDPKRTRGGHWAWWLEVLGIGLFWCWYGRVLVNCGSWKISLAYLLASHVFASPVHVQIVLSHFSMSTADLGPTESFADRQLRTTTDVICDESLGWIHGGLHLQVTHHLFPRLPRHNLKAASLLVKEFAAEQGLVYAEFGWINGQKDVLGVLKSVADQVKLIGTVANIEAKDVIDRKLGSGVEVDKKA